ncbi:hypothetical protein KCP73_06000 [Salmonella enterica subsp. enterica]|nr:hypothetical protein KCP73_06000 [Salmonella enterica subsp. enterica]
MRGLFATFWFIYSPHRWQYWSMLAPRSLFLSLVLVEVGALRLTLVRTPFYDLKFKRRSARRTRILCRCILALS